MKNNLLTQLHLKNFTAFSSLDMEFSPGVNVLIGANGTGKTHILKLLYSACDITRDQGDFKNKIFDVFLPYQRRMERLAYQQKTNLPTVIAVKQNGNKKISATISEHNQESPKIKITGIKQWHAERLDSSYIPVKEMLAHAPGFRSLYSAREIQFESIYADIIDRSYLPKRKGAPNKEIQNLLKKIEGIIQGKVIAKEEFFFLKNAQGELEFSLLVEGFRKLALLWILIQNGSISPGTILFWDEPEANLNPKLIGSTVEILLELQRLGVQIFLSTHSYMILKEFDLHRKSQDQVRFHSFFRKEVSSAVTCQSTDSFEGIHPNPILDAYVTLYDRDVERDFAEYK